jgi:hypothetical protein
MISQVPSRTLPGGTEEYRESPHSELEMFGSRFECGTRPLLSRNAIHSIVKFGFAVHDIHSFVACCSSPSLQKLVVVQLNQFRNF